MTALPPRRRPAAFTLVETLVAVAVTIFLILTFSGLIDQTNAIWRRTTGKIEQFRGARDCFETMTSRLAQATLNVHWAYDNLTAPTRYERNSELRFISGPARELFGAPVEGRERVTQAVFFQAPLGVKDEVTPPGFEYLLTTCGYYVEYGDDLGTRPSFVTTRESPARYRYRLFELWQPAQNNTIYRYTSGVDGAGLPLSRSYAGREWFRDVVNAPGAPVHVLAENVVALIVIPRLAVADEAEVKVQGSSSDLSPLAPDYLYDSAPPAPGNTDPRYHDGRLNPVSQLPPLLQVTMVTIDEASALRMNLRRETSDFFQLHPRFQQTASYTHDLLRTGDAQSLENELIARGANYRIFSSNVQIRGARWSRAQTNP